MENALDKQLYMKAKRMSDKIYGKKTSAYKSMYIQKQYQRMGGSYSKKGKGLKNWRDEKWIQVLPFLTEGKRIACGDGGTGKKSCRPTKKIDSKTPITINELIKIHGKKKLIEIATEKVNNMDKRINWKMGKLY